MKVYFIPKTTLGKWSVALIVGFLVLIISFQFLVALGQRGGETFFSALLLTVPIIIAGIFGVSAFGIGLVGVIKSRERSIIVYLAVTIGLFVLLFGLGEIIFPH
ncbi:hypothetical protein ACFLYV_03140 [Chloroflexota bacterium]